MTFMGKNRQRGGLHWGWIVGGGCFVLLVLAVVGIIAAFMPMMKKMQAASQPMHQCEVNLTAVAAALKAYKADHDDEYPAKLVDLVPKYLPDKSKLHCPEVKDQTVEVTYDYLRPPKNAPRTFVVVSCPNHTFMEGLTTMYFIIQKDGSVLLDQRSPLRGGPRGAGRWSDKTERK